MKEKVDWNLGKALLLKGYRAKEVFQEPSDWQSRLMRSVRNVSVSSDNTFEMELNTLNPFAIKLTMASLLLTICMQSYVWSSSSSARADDMANLIPNFSAVDILWEDQ